MTLISDHLQDSLVQVGPVLITLEPALMSVKSLLTVQIYLPLVSTHEPKATL